MHVDLILVMSGDDYKLYPFRSFLSVKIERVSYVHGGTGSLEVTNYKHLCCVTSPLSCYFLLGQNYP
jgi:hypothetical protein